MSMLQSLREKLKSLFCHKKQDNQRSCVSTSTQPIDLSLKFEERTFYIIFTNLCSGFHTKFLKNGFKHVYAVEQLEHVFLVYQPTKYGLNVFMAGCTTQDPFIESIMMLDKTASVVKLIVRPSGKFVLWPKPLTCVSQIEYALGLSGMSLTPHQLYKRLVTGRDKVIKRSEGAQLS